MWFTVRLFCVNYNSYPGTLTTTQSHWTPLSHHHRATKTHTHLTLPTPHHFNQLPTQKAQMIGYWMVLLITSLQVLLHRELSWPQPLVLSRSPALRVTLLMWKRIETFMKLKTWEVRCCSKAHIRCVCSIRRKHIFGPTFLYYKIYWPVVKNVYHTCTSSVGWRSLWPKVRVSSLSWIGVVYWRLKWWPPLLYM